MFVTEQGKVGAIRPGSETVRTLDLGERITNSIATDETGGVYVVTTAALYRIDVYAGGPSEVDLAAGSTATPVSTGTVPGQT